MLTLSFILAQISGFCSVIVYIISTQRNERKKILFWRNMHNLFDGIEYVLLGAYTGVAVNVIGTLRNITFARFRKSIPIVYIAIFILINVISAVVLYDGPISLIPIIHSVIMTLCLADDNLTISRLVQAFSVTLLLIYNINVGAYIGILMVAVQFVSLAFGIVRFDGEKLRTVHRKRRSGKRAHKL